MHIYKLKVIKCRPVVNNCEIKEKQKIKYFEKKYGKYQ